ncbi:MAG TPA: TM0106 family RecB-like putative nuclease [Candidatus Acidoferrum sp.]|nr:TM0106 family RecB-like putative nuclease [Candidatus Acidoferrum sp.]
MKTVGTQIRLTGSDLSNHLACRHLTTLELQVARRERTAPDWTAPDLKVIQELGLRHEKAYLAHLAAQGLKVENLGDIEHHEEQRLLAETLALMNRGVEVIAQGALSDGEWFGRPDVLRRVEKKSKRWAWSYEVADTKLARETKATTILQLSLYSELLEKIQETKPEFLWVVPPGEGYAGEKYLVLEYAAYYRQVKNRLVRAIGGGPPRRAVPTKDGAQPETYPEPVEHCSVCRWFKECDQRRRADDHLSLVAGIRRQQRDQFEKWNAETMAKLAVLPIPLKKRPEHGSRAGYERVREQARVQVEGRTEKKLKHEPLLPPVEGMGFCRLPEPSAGDMFVDLEGDPFVGENGLQYLFGFAESDAQGELKYEKRWALNREEEKKGFEWLVDEIIRRRETNPKMHVYHFGAYEPGALKRLMGMYATREDQIDRMLRAGVMVDLHQAFKQGLRASVEEYSLKKLEGFWGFERKTPLDDSRVAMRYVEHRLELGRMGEELPDEIRETMEGYNAEDCVSTAKLRDWLEQERKKLVASGVAVPRLAEKSGDPSEKLKEKLDRVAELTERLSAEIPADPAARTEEQAARWLLAQLLSWHRREDKRAWQDGYRYAEMNDEDLLDERVGLTRMNFVERVGSGRQVPTDHYSFESHRSNVRAGKELYFGDEKFGEVVTIDQAAGVVDIKKTKKTAEVHPPTVYMWSAPLPTDSQAGALYRIGAWVAENGVDAAGRYRAGRDLLLRQPPRLIGGEKLQQFASETVVNTANRIVLALEDSVFPIQGPPGSGKTYTGARMICEVVKSGKRIGITALSHKVIRKLLDDVVAAAHEMSFKGVRCLHRDNEGEESDGVAVAREGNEEAWEALITGKANAVGGTSWLWSPEKAFESVDVLFIDEAGQMSLADVLAVSQAAKKLVLLGDPQQLERPTKGSHPEGAEKSALEHLLNGRKTIEEGMGFLLPETWRLHPRVCGYTSDFFYDGRLRSHPISQSRVIEGHAWLNGAGLWIVPVEHDGNRNSSAEESELVARIVEGLLKPGVVWLRSAGNPRGLKEEDILIVAPYNAQVSDLKTRLPKMRIGTVDKFQGQEAPVVIYSLTTSSPEDAPRGMEFLYSLNRLNVATSRAMTAVILVGSPKLFEPECRTPRQMQLANAFCGYFEMATTLDPSLI